MRTLFVSGEVAPFTKDTELSEVALSLPARLFETGNYETRIMMPRYGIVSERKNRLHEVIRLSGTEIPLGDEKETLKVKVASIPGFRLQVYFMDNTRLFKRKGIFADKQGKLFPDNLERALFFGRGVIETIRSLGWAPDVVHTLGWISGLVPALLRTEYAADPLFQDAKILFTPQVVDFEARFTEAQCKRFGLPSDLAGKTPVEIGLAHADAVLYPPSWEQPENGPRLSGGREEMAEQAASLYEQVLNGVPA